MNTELQLMTYINLHVYKYIYWEMYCPLKFTLKWIRMQDGLKMSECMDRQMMDKQMVVTHAQ